MNKEIQGRRELYLILSGNTNGKIMEFTRWECHKDDLYLPFPIPFQMFFVGDICPFYILYFMCFISNG